MLTFFKIVVGIYVICSISILGFDFVMNCSSMIKRYGIGSWKNSQEWHKAIKERAYKWLIKTPTVRQTDNYRYLILDILHGKYRNATIQSWQTAGLMLGIAEADEEEGKRIIEKWKENNLTKSDSWVHLENKVDFAMLGFAMLKTTEETKCIKPAMDAIMEIIESNLCEDGLISYSQGSKAEIRFVDTLGMVCPFLAAYGNIYHEKCYILMAVRQIETYRKFGLLPGTDLPCHAYSIKNKAPLGIYGWGRGTAWYFLSLINTWKELENYEEGKKLKQWIEEAAESYLQYQLEDGGFCSILQGGGQYESSVTAAMAYFYQNCGEIFDKQVYYQVTDKCLEKLKTCTLKNGAVDLCQGDTHGIGSFSQVYDTMPFAQGLVLQTLSMRGKHK